MPTQITQRESEGRIFFQIEGDMLAEDAALVERIAREANKESGSPVTIDLADLDFLDSDSASILMRLSQERDIEIDGMELFLQAAIDAAERGSSA